ncbi:MAG: mechanosensitive ion channel family protein [Thermoplasmata archaeon]
MNRRTALGASTGQTVLPPGSPIRGGRRIGAPTAPRLLPERYVPHGAHRQPRKTGSAGSLPLGPLRPPTAANAGAAPHGASVTGSDGPAPVAPVGQPPALKARPAGAGAPTEQGAPGGNPPVAPLALPDEAPPSSVGPSASSPSAYLLFLVPVGLIAAGIALYYFIEHLKVIPISYDLVFRLALVFLLGYLLVVLVGRVLVGMAPRWAGARRGARILSVYRFIAYTGLFVALLETAGVSSLALLAGGTFAGIVIGLAGQTVLSNVMAGLFLLFVRPFEPGDRITMTTWQYGQLAAAYPPKFFSQDLIVPGFTGVVFDIGIAYTTLTLDDATRFRMPNSILIQAAVISHELTERWVRLKYEVPPTVPPERLLPMLAAELASNPWIAHPDSIRVRVNQATQASYVISVDAVCKGNLEEPPRSALLIATMRTVRELALAEAAAHPGTPKG